MGIYWGFMGTWTFWNGEIREIIMWGKRLTCAHKTDSVAHTVFHWILTHLRTPKSDSVVHTELSGDGEGWGKKRSCSCAHTSTATWSFFLLSSRHGHYSFMISNRWGGVGWGEVITFMFLCTHRHSKPYHLSCCPADAGTILFHDQLPVGWGGVITFMFLCTHRHSNLIIVLALQQTQALLFHDQLPVGWGGVIAFMFLCTHRHNNLIIFLALQRQRHFSFLISYRHSVIDNKSAKRQTWKQKTAEIQGHHCRDCVETIVGKSKQKSRDMQ